MIEPDNIPDGKPDPENDDFVETKPEGPGVNTGETAGSLVTSPIKAIVGFLRGMLYAVTRIMPYGRAFWSSIAKLGIKNLRKASGGDIVGIVGRGDGRLELKPMKYKQHDDEPGSPNRWVSKDGEEWHPGAEGKGYKYIGSTPVALFHETAVPRGSWFQSNYAEALQLGNKQQLYADAEVSQEVVINANSDESKAQAAQKAKTDGGINYDDRWNVEYPGMLEDVLVDLDPGDGSQGMRVSTEKYAEVFQERVGSEEMQMQEVRGRAAEVDPESQRDMMFRFLKYFLGGVVLARSPELLALLMGESGAGVGGSIPPLMIDALAVMPL